MLSEADQAALAERVADLVIKHLNDNPPMPLGPWRTPEQAACHVGLTPGGLATMRHNGTGPAYKRPTWRIVRYHVDALDKWLEDYPERRDPKSPRLPGDPTPGGEAKS